MGDSIAATATDAVPAVVGGVGTFVGIAWLVLSHLAKKDVLIKEQFDRVASLADKAIDALSRSRGVDR